MTTNSPSHPPAIAIAGAWGYIGRKFLEAASALDLPTYVLDPGPPPEDLTVTGFEQLHDAQAFYALPVPFYHLGLHPEQRRPALHALLQRGQRERLLVLNEKPMAHPAHPEECRHLVDQAEHLTAVVLFDFPELFDHMTTLICDYLLSHKVVQIDHMQFCRSKDREARDNPRNHKRMVPIQYQESVHCLAFALYVLSRLSTAVEPVLEHGVSVDARSQLYDPPNPSAYPYPVDGRCDYHLELAGVSIDGRTDFKSGARWSKYRRLEGVADGKPFQIEADYLEGRKYLRINGVDHKCPPAACSYQQAITTAWHWFHAVPQSRLMTGVYPNPRFARMTYQLSSLLWLSSQSRQKILVPSAEALLGFDAEFARRSGLSKS